MTSAQVVETSVTNNSSFQNYTYPDDHTIRTNKLTVATRQEKKPTNLHNKSQQSCSTIKANKFPHTAGTIKTQKVNEVETHRSAFKSLITTTKSAPKRTKTDYIAGKFWWKSRNKQHLNTQTD